MHKAIVAMSYMWMRLIGRMVLTFLTCLHLKIYPTPPSKKRICKADSDPQNYHQRAEYLQTTSRVQCPNKALGCVAQATSPADLVQHMKKCTADQGQFICKSCDGNFESRTALCTHLAEECRGERKRQLVSEEGFVKLKQITDRILKEGKGYEGIGYSNIRHRLYSM